MSPVALWILIRPRPGEAVLGRLQLLATTMTAVFSFTVVMLSAAALRVPTDEVGYLLLAAAPPAVLLVPLLGLGTASARLTARSREERLAGLRLLGARSAAVRAIAAAEVLVTAVLGTLLGAAIAFLLPYPLALLTLHGAPLTPELLHLPWWIRAAVVAVLVGLAAVMTALGLAGPFVIARVARRRAARTSDAAHLVAARSVLDDPREAWRQVSALGLAAFVLIPAGCLLGYLQVIENSESRAIMTADQLLVFGDARTLLALLVLMAFLVVACQVAITQTAAVLERRELYVALDRNGMPRRELERARRGRVTMPAIVAVVGAATAASIVGVVLVFVALVMAPGHVAGIVVILGFGLLLVHGGVVVTTPVMRRVLAAPDRGE